MDYLSRLDDTNLDLILEFARDPLATHPDLALQACLPHFLARSMKLLDLTKDSLQIFFKLKLNQKTSDRHAIALYLDAISSMLCVTYLEFLVWTLADATPSFHDKIAQELLSSLSEDADTRGRLQDFLLTSHSYDAESLLRHCPPGKAENLGSASKQNSNQKSSLFSVADERDLRALLFSRLGQYRQALSLYLDGPDESQKRGEEWVWIKEGRPYDGQYLIQFPTLTGSYCLQVFHATGAKEIFVDLLELYLEKNDVERCLELLREYGTYMEPKAVVERLPTGLKVNALNDYWEKSLQEVVMEGRILQLVGRLAEAEHFQVRQDYIATRRRRLEITGERICPRCGKRLGSAGFLLTTSGNLFHYTCIS